MTNNRLALFAACLAVASLLLLYTVHASSTTSAASLEEKRQLFKAQQKLTGSNFKCTICVVVMTIVENEVRDDRAEIKKLMEKICNYLPGTYNATCVSLIHLFGDQIIDSLLAKEDPSKICNDLKLFQCNGCSLKSYASERLMSGVELSDEERLMLEREHRDVQLRALVMSHVLYRAKRKPYMAMMPNKPRLTGDRLIPFVDMDNDFFSPTHEFIRGADWRGMDCNDKNNNVRPGVYDTSADVDANCNGIYKADSQGNMYEQMLCKNSGERTIAMFGDSASSGFHIPAEWLHVRNISHLLMRIEDEFDWPQMTYATGFDDSINGTSIYLQMRARNRCNHRDYQNVGHNGHSARHLAEQQVNALSINANSKPLLAFIAYIGNDVCKSSTAKMTKPEEFRAQMLLGLQMLDKRAPPNSKVMLMGLVDGRILWDEMHDKIHPFGATYAQVYNFLDCTDANPCPTWLTSNETTRNATSFRAAELSAVAKDIAASSKGKYQNIELDYVDFPLPYAIQYCKDHGISPSVLIEAFDGFHPSHFGHRLFADYLWQILQQRHPDWLGQENPNNSQIVSIFGNQGGH